MNGYMIQILSQMRKNQKIFTDNSGNLIPSQKMFPTANGLIILIKQHVFCCFCTNIKDIVFF